MAGSKTRGHTRRGPRVGSVVTGARTLVIGVGNAYRSDDAAGLLAARHVRVAAPHVAVLESSGEVTELMEAWHDAAAVVLVDAVQTGAPPGTVHRWEAHERSLPRVVVASSTHAFGVGEAIEIARALDRLPGRVVVYGIEGACFVPGTAPSPEVEGALPGLAARVLREAVELAGRTPEQEKVPCTRSAFTPA